MDAILKLSLVKYAKCYAIYSDRSTPHFRFLTNILINNQQDPEMGISLMNVRNVSAPVLTKAKFSN